MKRFIAFLPLLLMVSCQQSSRPSEVLEPEEMAVFLTEACKIEARFAVATQYRFNVLTTEASQSYDSLLQAMGYAAEQVDSSMSYYAAHLDEYQPILDSVAARVERFYAQNGGAVGPSL